MTASNTTEHFTRALRPVLACALAAAVAVSLTPAPDAGRALAQDLATASPAAVQPQAETQKETVYVIDDESANMTYIGSDSSRNRYSYTYKYNKNGLLADSAYTTKYSANGNLTNRVSTARTWDKTRRAYVAKYKKGLISTIKLWSDKNSYYGMTFKRKSGRIVSYTSSRYSYYKGKSKRYYTRYSAKISYGKAGRPSKHIVTDKQRGYKFGWNYAYDKKGNVRQIKELVKGKVIRSTAVQNVYDSEGLLTKQVLTNRAFKTRETYTFSYKPVEVKAGLVKKAEAQRWAIQNIDFKTVLSGVQSYGHLLGKIGMRPVIYPD